MTTALNTASADLDGFRARFVERQAQIARLEEQRRELQRQLSEQLAGELVDGRSTGRKQADLRQRISAVADELQPLLDAQDHGVELFRQAERVAASRQFEAAAAQRAQNPQRYTELLDALDAALAHVRDLNDQLGRLRDADADACDAQRRAIALGGLAGESATPALPFVGFQVGDVQSWFDALRRDRQQLTGGR